MMIMWVLLLVSAAILGIGLCDFCIHGHYDMIRAQVGYGHMVVGIVVIVASQFIASPYGGHRRPPRA